MQPERFKHGDTADERTPLLRYATVEYVFMFAFLTLMRKIPLPFILSLWCLAFFGTPAVAQIRTYNTAEGLTQSWIFAFHQDKLGRMWMATGDGISRFDGSEFIRVPCVSRYGFEIKRFSGNFHTDYLGRIWIGGLNGIFCYDFSTGKFYDKTELAGVKNLTGTSRIFYSGGTQIGFSDEAQNIYFIDLVKNNTCRYDFRKQLIPDDGIVSICRINKGKYLIATTKTVYHWDSGNALLSPTGIRMEYGAHNFYKKSNNEIYLVGTKIYKMSPDLKNAVQVYKQYFPGDFYVRTLQFENGNIWVGTSAKGLLVLDSNGKLVKQYTKTMPAEQGIAANDVACIYRTDTEIWVGTDGGGLSIIPEKEPFFLKKYAGNVAHFKKSSFVKCIYKDEKKRLWVGLHEGGLIRFDPDLSDYVEISVPGKTVSLISKSNQNLWIGTDNGMFLMNPENLKITRVADDPLVVRMRITSFFNAAVPDDNGGLLIATNSGIAHLDASKMKYSIISDTGSVVLSIYRDPEEKYILAGMYSDYMWKYRFSGLNNGQYTKSRQLIRNAARVRCIIRDKDKFWLCSETGLLQADADGKILKIWDERNGLKSSFTYSALQDASGALWISTNRGITRIEPGTGYVRNFGLNDNLQNYEFNTGAYYQSDDGWFYTGGIQGFNAFKPLTYRQKPIKNSLFLRNVVAGNIKINADSVFNSGWLILNHDNNNLRIDFAISEYTNASELEYFYRLNDQMPWTSIGNNSYLLLGNLAYGYYQIQVKVRNADGMESPVTTLFKLRIVPPFYSTWWFAVLIIILSVLIISLLWYFFYKQKLRIKTTELHKEKELQGLKQKISRDLHDNLGSTISRLHLLAHALNIRRESKSNSAEDIRHIANELKSQLDEIVWAVNTGNDYLANFLAYLRLWASQMSEEAGIKVFFDLPEVSSSVPLSGVLRQNLFSICKEALNNSLKYAEASEFRIRFIQQDENRFILELSDNGKGFDLTAIRPFANGLKNMEKRAIETGSEFKIKSETGKGTTVSISGSLHLPLS